MFKLSALLSALFFVSYSSLYDFSLPQPTGTAADYFLMPFMGYLAIFFAAQIAGRLMADKAPAR